MRRRDFLKLAGLMGMSISAPFGNIWGQEATNYYDGPFWVMINAEGGWDPTILFDPKGNANASRPVNHYAVGDILQTGNIQYAPRGNNQTFFEKYYSQLLVINGIDTKTNNHEVGVRHSWSGLFREGYPTLGGLLAASLAPEAPLGFITNGGYDSTAGLIAPSRIDQDNLRRLAFSNQIGEDNSEHFHSDYALDRIAAARQERKSALLDQNKLPNIQRSINQLHLSHQGVDDLKRVFDHLPSGGEPENELHGQARLALAAYKAGISTSVNLNFGGFDTHTAHDAEHEPLLDTLLEGIDLVMQEAENQQVAHQVVIVVGSDFGRTPWYNQEQGKDHWPIGSMMFMGKGIRGNRVIGATDESQNAQKVNVSTLATDEEGITITPAHIHLALRNHAGIANSAASAQFPLDVDALDLFS